MTICILDFLLTGIEILVQYILLAFDTGFSLYSGNSLQGMQDENPSLILTSF
jgi:hypothetical protein